MGSCSELYFKVFTVLRLTPAPHVPEQISEQLQERVLENLGIFVPFQIDRACLEEVRELWRIYLLRWTDWWCILAPN